MAALRWILLLAGLLFLGALAAWEMRRPRQSARELERRPERRAERNEPGLGTLAEEESSAARVTPSVPRAVRGRVLAPPRIDLPPLEPIADVPEGASADAAFESEQVQEEVALQQIASDTQDERREPYERASEGALLPADALMDSSVTSALPGAELEQELSLTDEGCAAPLEPWPAQLERQILSFRLVASEEERWSGRALRQAFAACGFVYGRLGVFHRLSEDGREVISAANVSKPGTFDPVNMDFQRFAGVSLFAVVPGPLTPTATMNQLLDAAHDLTQRLPSQVHDERGEPLDEAGLEGIWQRVQQLPNATLHAEPAA